MTSTFTRLSPTNLPVRSPPPIPNKHWSETCHETILVSNDPNQSIRIPLAGGAENGEFIYFNESISLLKTKTSTNIVQGGKIDSNEIILEIDHQRIAGCTLSDIRILIETLSKNSKQIQLKTVKYGLTKDLRQFLDGRFDKDSIDYDLQQTIRDNLYMRTVPCTTRPPRSGEINGQDYTFLSVKDFRTLEKSGNLLESGVYNGHYYGTPRPTNESIMTNTNLARRSHSANEMFQHEDPEVFQTQQTTENHHSTNLNEELITSSLQKSSNGFGFTIIGGYEKGEQYLQIKDILPDGPAAKDGKLQRGDILVYVNNTNVLNHSHTDVVKIFQNVPIGDTIHITVCRGYPFSINLDDPRINVVSVNGVHNLPNGGYEEHQLDSQSRIYIVKIRKGDNGFGFTIADSPSGQRIKSIVDRQRCQNLCENDLLLSINGEDLSNKQHSDVVNILKRCSNNIETTFVIRRGDQDINNNNPFITNGFDQFDRNSQENDQIDIYTQKSKQTEKPRSKTPTSFGSTPMTETLPVRSRTPLPMTTNDDQNSSERSIPRSQTDFSSFERQISSTRSARDVRSSNTPSIRSKTPGTDIENAKSSSSYRLNTIKPRSKTPTSYEFSSNTIQNSRSLQSVHPQNNELIVNLTLLPSNDGFGLRILGGEEEQSQVSIGHIVPNSPAAIDGRLCIGDEIIKIDNHSTIRATHEKVVQLMQRAKENQHVCLLIRRYENPEEKPKFTRQISHDSYTSSNRDSSQRMSFKEKNLRFVTLKKLNENQSFGFVIISSQNQAGAAVDSNREKISEQMDKIDNSNHKIWIGKIIPNSPADLSGQLHVNDRILAVNDIDITHMPHTDVVNLIKDSGRTITLTLGRNEDQGLSNGIRPTPTMRNSHSQSRLNSSEKNLTRPPSRTNGILKSPSTSNDYFLVDLQRSSINSSFGFSIRGGREFSIPLYILKLADNGPAAYDGQMRPGDQIIEINSRSTYGMTHSDAIALIREGGLYVRLLLRKTNAPPPSLDEVKLAMGNGHESVNTHWKPSGFT